MRTSQFRDDIKIVLATLFSNKSVALMLIAGLTGVSIATNLVVLYASTGNPPNAIVLNDGVFQRLESRALDDPALTDPFHEFAEATIPYFNYPILWFEFNRKVQVSDENGVVTENLPARFYLTPHYFFDFMPISLLLSVYLVISREWSKGRTGIKEDVSTTKGHLSSITHRAWFGRKRYAGAAATIAAPSGSATASTALTSLAAGACCGAFAVESSVYILGFAIGAAGIILVSRTLLLLVGFLMVVGIMRTARKLNSSCAVLR